MNLTGAPEVLDKRTQDAAVDWWAVGCVLYFCITGGRYLFEHKGINKQKAHVSSVLLEVREKRHAIVNQLDSKSKCILYILYLLLN